MRRSILALDLTLCRRMDSLDFVAEAHLSPLFIQVEQGRRPSHLTFRIWQDKQEWPRVTRLGCEDAGTGGTACIFDRVVMTDFIIKYMVHKSRASGSQTSTKDVWKDVCVKPCLLWSRWAACPEQQRQLRLSGLGNVPDHVTVTAKCRSLFPTSLIFLHSTTTMSDEEQIKRAITHLKAQKQLNIAAASKQFKIPHMTLSAHFHGQRGLHQKATANTRLKLFSVQKKTLIVYINKLSKYELSSISEIVRNLVYKLLKSEIDEYCWLQDRSGWIGF